MVAPMAVLTISIVASPGRLVPAAHEGSLSDLHSAPKVNGLDQSSQVQFSRTNRSKEQDRGEYGLLPLPKGEGWGEGLQTIEGSDPPHPHPLRSRSRMFPTSATSLSGRTRVNPSSDGERESRRAVFKLRVHQQSLQQQDALR